MFEAILVTILNFLFIKFSFCHLPQKLTTFDKHLSGFALFAVWLVRVQILPPQFMPSDLHKFY